jgi:SAM-dependent methyltransferase
MRTLLPALFLVFAACGESSSPPAPPPGAPGDPHARGPAVREAYDRNADRPEDRPGPPERSHHTPHAVPLARAEHLLVRWAAEQDPALLEQAAGLAGGLVRPGERQDYARFLLAFVHRLQGEPELAQQILDQTHADRRHFYDRFYSGALEPVLPYLRANVALACQESPEPLADLCAAYQDVPEPLEYRAFQQGSWVQHAQDRLATWGPGAAGLELPELFASLGIQPGMEVVDVGAGDGWFAIPLARWLGPRGRLVANEVDPGLVSYLGHAADYYGLDTMSVVLGGPTDIGLEPASVDRVFICEVLRHVYVDARSNPDPEQTARSFHASMFQALRPGGQLIVIDHAAKPGDPKALPTATIQADLEAVGFELLEQSDRFGPLQVVLRFERPG